jgi:RNA recognition motif-containing protein
LIPAVHCDRTESRVVPDTRERAEEKPSWKGREIVNIFVGNLPFTATSQDLENLFSAYGTVTSAAVINDRDTGRSRGFGFVEMDNGAGAKAIEELDGTDFSGRALKVNEARPRESRPRR